MKIAFILTISLFIYDMGQTYLIEKVQPSGPMMCEQLAQQTVGCTYYSFSTSDLLCKVFTGHPRQTVSGTLVRIQKKQEKKRAKENCPTASVVLKTRTRSHYCVRSTDSCLGKGYRRLSNLNVCYKKHTERRKWPAARKICQEEGGDLMSLNTAQKHMETVDSMKRGYPNVKIYRIWVGMRRSPRKRSFQYRWITRGPNFTKWIPGDPDYRDGETCVFVMPDGLADGHCSREMHFMCETILH